MLEQIATPEASQACNHLFMDIGQNELMLLYSEVRIISKPVETLEFKLQIN